MAGDKMEARIDDIQAASMLALRMMADFYNIQVEAGTLTKAQAIGLIRFAAEQVGEGSPHLDLNARSIAEAIVAKFQ